MNKRIIAVLLMAWAAPLIADAWVPYGEHGGDDAGDATCGAIGGIYGSIYGFDDASLSTSEYIFSHGWIGGRWYGTEPSLASVAPTILNDLAYHTWIKDGGAAPAKGVLRAQSATQDSTFGSSSQFNVNDSQWWWRPTVTATIDEPHIQKFNTGTSNWDNQTWTNTWGDTGAGSYTAGQPPDHQGSPITPTIVTLDQRHSFTMTSPGANNTQYRVSWALHTSVTAGADNVSVPSYWVQSLHCDLGTGLTTSANVGNDFAFF